MANNQANNDALAMLSADIQQNIANAELGLGDKFLPIDAFRPALQDLMNKIASDLDVHRDKVVMAMMMATCGLVGRKATLVTPQYRNHPALMGVLIDYPGAGKSKVNNELFKVFSDIDNELRTKANEFIEEKKPEKGSFIPNIRGTYNVTIERLNQFLEKSDTGCFEYVDEMSRLFESQGKYSGGKGGEWTQRMTLYNGTLEPDDRKGDTERIPIAKKDIAYSLYGTMQPSRVAQYIKPIIDLDNGGFNRLLFIKTPFRPLKERSILTEKESDMSQWVSIVRSLNELPTGREYNLSAEAAAVYDKFYIEYVRDYNAARGNCSGMLSYRMRNGQQVQRLVITLHLLNNWQESTISASEMDMAVRMMRVFNQNAQEVLDMCSTSSEMAPVRSQKNAKTIAVRNRYLLNYQLGYPTSRISQKQLAKEVGCVESFVAKIKKAMLANGEISDEDMPDDYVEEEITENVIKDNTQNNPEKKLEAPTEETPATEAAPEEKTSGVESSYTKKTSDVKVNPPQDPPKIRSDNDRNPENPENSDISPTPSS